MLKVLRWWRPAWAPAGKPNPRRFGRSVRLAYVAWALRGRAWATADGRCGKRSRPHCLAGRAEWVGRRGRCGLWQAEWAVGAGAVLRGIWWLPQKWAREEGAAQWAGSAALDVRLSRPDKGRRLAVLLLGF